MAKKKEEKNEYDEMYQDEPQKKILTSKGFHTVKEKEPNTTKQIRGLLEDSMSILDRNLKRKDEAFVKIREAIKLLERLK